MYKNSGLEEAVKRIGGAGAVARALEIAPASVAAWKCVPAEYVLAVEALTGVARTALRPDLYPDTEVSVAADRDEVDVARSAEYALIAALVSLSLIFGANQIGNALTYVYDSLAAAFPSA